VTLRTKLLLAQLPLLLATALTIAVALVAARRLGSEPDTIIEENFRSFDAARAMLTALDRIEAELARSALIGERPDHERIAAAVAEFEEPLALQQANITEPGEDEATAQLVAAWQNYVEHLASERGVALDDYLVRSDELRERIEVIFAINRGGMRSKADAASDDARRQAMVVAATGLVALIVALPVGIVLVRRLLRPVRVMAATAARLGGGDFDVRVRLEGHGDDEVHRLAAAFNEMAGRLGAYRASSLGDLLEANERLQSVVDSLPESVIVCDTTGLVLQANAAAGRLLGEPTRLDGLPSDLAQPIRAVFDRVVHTQRASEPAGIADAIAHARGSELMWLAIGATPVFRDHRLAGVTLALRDVSQARRLEGFRGDLVSAAAHELRTPLTSLHMAVHLCLEEAAGPLDERQEDLLTAARSDCERLQSVVDELLDLARAEAGSIRLELYPRVVQSMLHDARARHEVEAERRGIAIEVVSPEAGLRVMADRSRLAQVFDNLIENALLHAEGVRRIELGAEQVHGAAIRFWVDDDGAGIPVELRPRVFDKFVRGPAGKAEGTGLGLSIVRDLVRAHHGEVGVEQAALGGARLWFELPLRVESEPSDQGSVS
jgi:NtrC-family two-component system sensor histidine kinase KinB